MISKYKPLQEKDDKKNRRKKNNRKKTKTSEIKSKSTKFREITLSMKLKILFSDVMLIIGVVFFFSGLLFIVPFAITMNSMLPYWSYLIMAIFPVQGILMAINPIILKKREINLLENGEIAFGKLINAQPTNTRINNQLVYKLLFEYPAKDGNNYQATIKTHKTYKITTDEQKKLLYDIRKPTQIVLIDLLPDNAKLLFQ